jgi:two-component system response regulator YesN
MRHLLIVDDEPNIVEGLHHSVLEHFGDDIDVSKAYNGSSALCILTKSPIDLVITDIRMPGISGLDLIQQIHERRMNCRVLVLTGYDDFAVVREAMRKPVLADFLLKTESDEEILKAISKVFKEITEEEKRFKSLTLAENREMGHNIDETKPAILMFARIFSAGANADDDRIWLNGMITHMFRSNFKIEMSMLDSNDMAWIMQINEGCEGKFPFTNTVELSQHIRSNIYEAQSRLFDDGIEMSAVILPEWVYLSDWPKYIRVFKNIIKDKRQQVINITTDGKTEGEETDVIAAVHEYLEKHLADHSLSLADIAAASYYNPAYLSRMYKRVTGIGLNDKINDMRVTIACDLLNNSGLKINEISQKAGFASPSYFTLNFRKRMGMTPKEYKLRNSKTRRSGAFVKNC